MDRSFQSVTKTDLNYTAVGKLQYSVSFAEIGMNDIVDDGMRSQCLHNQWCLSYVQYTRLGRLKEKNTHVLPLLQSLSRGLGDGEKLRISHPDSEKDVC